MIWRLLDKWEWHRWFAWRPVLITYNGECSLVWLQYIERKRSEFVTWDYRLIGSHDD